MVSSSSNSHGNNANSTYSKKLLPLISWSHWFTFFNIIAAVLLSSFYIFSDPAPETFIGCVYLLTTWLSHIGFITFISFVLIIFPIILIFPRTHTIRVISSVIFTVGLLLLVLDALVYNQLGYHLNASSSDQIISLINNIIERDNRLFWFSTILLTLGILSFELVVSNYSWKHLRTLQKTIIAKYFVSLIMATFVISHVIHIWADANLKYDVLKQDTTLPLSYPTTAKALLTKYGLFNRVDYDERRSSPLAITDTIAAYPTLTPAQCQTNTPVENSTFIVLTSDIISAAQLKGFSVRSAAKSIVYHRHVDNALPLNSWFNLLYALPSIYKDSVENQNVKPLLFQLLQQKRLKSSFTRIGSGFTNIETSLPETYPHHYEWLFDNTTQLTDISSLVFAEKLNSYENGLHVLYFDHVNNYQFELFMHALLLAQKQKTVKDVIWASTIGNKVEDVTALSSKPSILFNPKMNGRKKGRDIHDLSSHMDVQNTISANWLSCNLDNNGVDLATLNASRVIANTLPDGIVVFNKDKSVIIDQHSNFQSYSSQLNAPITENTDFPLMIDGVNYIKQFNNAPLSQDSAIR